MNKIKRREKSKPMKSQTFLHNREGEMHPKIQNSVNGWITCKTKWIESLYSIVCLVMITPQLLLLLFVEHM